MIKSQNITKYLLVLLDVGAPVIPREPLSIHTLPVTKGTEVSGSCHVGAISKMFGYFNLHEGSRIIYVSQLTFSRKNESFLALRCNKLKSQVTIILEFCF